MKHATAFHVFKDQSVDAVNYCKRLQQCQDKDKTVRMQIDKHHIYFEVKEQNASKEAQENDPLLHSISEAQEDMADF